MKKLCTLLLALTSLSLYAFGRVMPVMVNETGPGNSDGFQNRTREGRPLSQSTLHGSGLGLLAQLTEGMQPGEWRKIPDSGIRWTIDYAPEPDDMNFWRGAILTVRSWCGAAFDSDGNKWYFHCGGHADYGGNEVYQYDFETLQWTQLTIPSPLTGPPMLKDGTNRCPAPAEGPAAHHTYDGIEWNPISQSFWLVGGCCPFCFEGMPRHELPPSLWEFGPVAKKWTRYELDTADHFAHMGVSGWQHGKIRVASSGVRMRTFTVDENGNVDNYQPVKAGGWVGHGNGAVGTDGFYRLYSEGILKLNTAPKKRSWEADHARWEHFAGTPQVVKNFHNWSESGLIWHDGLWVIWPGGAEIVTFDGVSWYLHSPTTDSAPVLHAKSPNRVYSKWIYIDELSLFAGYTGAKGGGIWVWKFGKGEILPPG